MFLHTFILYQINNRDNNSEKFMVILQKNKKSHRTNKSDIMDLMNDDYNSKRLYVIS